MPLVAEEAGLIHSVMEQFFPTIPVRSIGLLKGGRLNRNFYIDANTERFVLRRYDLNNSAHAIRYEHQLLDYLPVIIHTALIAKPCPSTANDTIVSDAGQHYALFPFLSGGEFEGGSRFLLSEAGRTLATYHNIAQAYVPEPRQRHGYGTVVQLDWAVKCIGGLAGLWQKVIDVPAENHYEQHARQSVEFLRREDRLAQKALNEAVYSSIPHMVIHGDFAAQNLLVSGSQVSGLLDFDLAVWEARAYDLAAALVWFSEDDNLSPAYPVRHGDRPWALNVERGAHFCSGYLRELERPLCQLEVDLLPWFMRRFLFWTAIWYLDLRVAGDNWYPHEYAGLISCLRWFQLSADAFTAAVMQR
jgi:homoserine kinase type II